ncbi:unnamed protein product [Lymnaea stagnalis]|uniref:Kringle domain-containing protein n=1 Tax=Lymnaea stagnalis TaxID=6523 RepID=A0AAV2ILA9_LYMST
MVTTASSSLCEVKAFGRKYDGVLECKQTEWGMDYKGHLNMPIKGRTCYPWASLNQSWFADYEFPDGSIADAQNYCRNPRVKSTNQPAQLFRPFCYYYVASINLIGWDYCELFSCEKGCRTTKMGTEYTGKINSTSPGSSPCDVWNRGASYFKRKSDFSLQDSPKTNSCRNPAGSQTRPWCYTNTTTLTYGYCDVPTCPTTDSTIIMTFDLNMTSDRAAFRAQVSVFRECLATQWAQASYYQPIYDAVMYQLCSSSGVRKNLLCYYNNNTAVLDYGDTATWMRIYITCPTDPLTTTTAVTTSISSQNTTGQLTTGQLTTGQLTTGQLTTGQLTTGQLTTGQLTTGQLTTDPVTATVLTSAVTSKSESSEPNVCPTSCQVTCSSGMSTTELKIYIEEIRHELVLDKSFLSKTIRTKVSAPDERPSARATAGVAIAVTVVTIACLISSDAISLSVFIYSMVKGKSPAVQAM